MHGTIYRPGTPRCFSPDRSSMSARNWSMAAVSPTWICTTAMASSTTRLRRVPQGGWSRRLYYSVYHTSTTQMDQERRSASAGGGDGAENNQEASRDVGADSLVPLPDRSMRDDIPETGDINSDYFSGDTPKHHRTDVERHESALHQSLFNHDYAKASGAREGSSPHAMLASIVEDTDPQSPGSSTLNGSKNTRRGRRRRKVMKKTSDSAAPQVETAQDRIEVETNQIGERITYGHETQATDFLRQPDDYMTDVEASNYNRSRPVAHYPSYYAGPYAPLIPYSHPPQPRSGQSYHYPPPVDADYHGEGLDSITSRTNGLSSTYNSQEGPSLVQCHRTRSLYSHHAASAPVLTPVTQLFAEHSRRKPLQHVAHDIRRLHVAPSATPGHDMGTQPLSHHSDHDGQPHLPRSENSSLQSNELSFSVSVQCSHATLHSRFSTLLHQYWPERTAHSDYGDVWVKRAMSSKRFKKRDGLHSIELMCHTGPSPVDSNDYQIQWL
jgi:hypothetical protein